MINLAIVGLYIGSGSLGGVTNYTRLLLNHLNQKEFSIHYFSIGKSPNWYEGSDKPTFLRFGVQLAISFLYFPFYLKQHKIKLVHLNSGLTQVSLFREGAFSLLAKLVGCKTLLFIHGWKKKEYTKILDNTLKRRFFSYILGKQNKVVVLAEQFKSDLLSLDVPDRNIVVSSTMVESEKYKPSDKKFQRPFKTLICVNMIREKGIFELLNAIPYVRANFPDTKFLFAGDGDDLNELKQAAQDLNLDEIDFPGYITGDEKISVFKDAHVFALPSYTEGFPTVVLEAMAAGEILLYTPVGGLANSLVDGLNGYEISSMPPDPKEIADKLIMLFNHPRTLKAMSRYNQIESKNKFDARIVSAAIEDLYKQIICT